MADSLEGHSTTDEALNLIAQPLEKLSEGTEIFIGQMRDLATVVQLVIRNVKQVNNMPSPVSSGLGPSSSTVQELKLIRSPEILNLTQAIRLLDSHLRGTEGKHRSEVMSVAAGVVAAEAIKPISAQPEIITVRRREKISDDEKQRRADDKAAQKRASRLAEKEVEWSAMEPDQAAAARAEYERRSASNRKGAETRKNNAARVSMEEAKLTPEPVPTPEPTVPEPVKEVVVPVTTPEVVSHPVEELSPQEKSAQTRTRRRLAAREELMNRPEPTPVLPVETTSSSSTIFPPAIGPRPLPHILRMPPKANPKDEIDNLREEADRLKIERKPTWNRQVLANRINRTVNPPIPLDVPTGGQRISPPLVNDAAPPPLAFDGPLFDPPVLPGAPGSAAEDVSSGVGRKHRIPVPGFGGIPVPTTPISPTPIIPTVPPVLLPGGPGSSGGGGGGGLPLPGGGSGSGGGSGGSGGGFPMGSSPPATNLWSLEGTQLQVLGALRGIATTLSTLSRGRLSSSRVPRPPRPPRLMNVNRAANVMGGAALGAAGGMLGLAGLIDPNALSTFTGSLKLLGQEIGKTFVPYVYAAADAIQYWTGAFASLDEHWKTLIGRGVVWTAGILLAGAAIAKTVAGVSLLTGAFQRLGLFLSAGAITTPWIAGLAALGIVAASVTAAFFAMGGAASVAGKNIADINLKANVDAPQLNNLHKQLQAIIPKELFDKVTSPDMKPQDRAQLLKDFKSKKEAETIELENRQLPLIGVEQKAYEERKAHIEAANTQMLQVRREAGVGERKIAYEKIQETLLQKGLTREEIMENIINPNSPLLTRQEIEKVKKGDALKQRPFTGAEGKQVGQDIEKNKQIISGLSNIIEKMGLGGFNTPDKIHDMKSPIASRYTDAMSYRESIQLAALNVPETEAEVLRNKMDEFNKNLGGDGPLIKAIEDQTKALADVLQKMVPFY